MKAVEIDTYIQKFARDNNITVEEAKEHKVVKEFIDYVNSKPDKKEDLGEFKIDCGCC